MEFIFGSGKKPEYNFHEDTSLHDQTPGPKAWNSNLGGDAIAVAKFIGRVQKSGFSLAGKQTVAELDVNDPVSRALSKQMVSMLWGSLLHPPHSCLGNKHKYRTADGSNNSIMFPNLGKAGLPYAKAVQGIRGKFGAKPDPGDLFDLLMARDEDCQAESSTGISSMLLYHATLIIHDIFRTSPNDKTTSDTSSYLDLTPLYGNDDDAQRAVRTGSEGLLKPDTFAEHRLLNQPPGVCAYLIMYNRFHNYVARQLLEINEDGRFAPPNKLSEVWKNMSPEDQKTALAQSDEDIFQTARLITCGMYIQIAIHDYLRCLMGMHPSDTPWTLNPRAEFSERNNKAGLPRGEGNVVSVEFNLLYRFHSPISVRDAEWSDKAFKGWIASTQKILPDDEYEALSPAKKSSGEHMSQTMLSEGDIPVPMMRRIIDDANQKARQSMESKRKEKCFPASFGAGKRKFTRNPDTLLFDDVQLVTELTRSMEDPICQFGAQNIPKIFRSVEILGMLEGRKWEIATLNEFREFFGMSRHKTFADINSNEDIQTKLRDLYEDPDMVELYPGLFCEGMSRNLDPGSSCPEGEGTALWRGVFSDAVTLVRSDRFYTTDWNVGSLTTWGMNEVKSDPTINKGSVFHRLFQRAFPGYFAYNSIHMWQPFYTPAMNLLLAQQQGYLPFLNLEGLEFDSEPILNAPVSSTDKNSQYDRIITSYQNTFKKEQKWSEANVASILNKMGSKDLAQRYRELSHRIRRSEKHIAAPMRPHRVCKYDEIVAMVDDNNVKNWMNPGISHKEDIPAGPLREMLTGQWDRWNEAIDEFEKVLKEHCGGEEALTEYFTEMSSEIRAREARKFQKYRCTIDGKRTERQAEQLDVVKDYAIPIITRFFVDFLGVWDQVKSVAHTDREYDENEIYRHLDNCQNYQSWDSDETKTWERRVAYKNSIKFLHTLASTGIANSSRGAYGLTTMFKRMLRRDNEEHEVVLRTRELAVKVITALKAKFSREEVTAVMLALALDISHKVVLTFTEIVAYYIDPTTHDCYNVSSPEEDDRTRIWADIKKLASAKSPHDEKHSNALIKLHVLETQRLSYKLSLARQFRGTSYPITRLKKGQNGMIVTDADGAVVEETVTVNKGDLVLLDLYTASQDATVFPDPSTFKVVDPKSLQPGEANVRDPKNYLVYGANASFTKKLSLAAMTGMLKHLAQLDRLRVAHDKMGRLKRVYVSAPGDDQAYYKYATPKWDMLVPFPATWNIRFDGLGDGVFADGDNANQGHGQDQVWRVTAGQQPGIMVGPDPTAAAAAPPALNALPPHITAQMVAAANTPPGSPAWPASPADTVSTAVNSPVPGKAVDRPWSVAPTGDVKPVSNVSVSTVPVAAGNDWA